LPAYGKEKVDVGRTHHPEPDIVVAVVRLVVVAESGARVVGIVVPTPATHHTPLVSGCPAGLPASSSPDFSQTFDPK
jgi:hypothetical protein